MNYDEDDDPDAPKCEVCDEPIRPIARAVDLKKKTCLDCGDALATQERKSWCVLTLHKQGAMLFTPAFAREAAIGANNKGGIVK